VSTGAILTVDVEKWDVRFERRAEASVTFAVAAKWDRGSKLADGGVLRERLNV